MAHKVLFAVAAAFVGAMIFWGAIFTYVKGSEGCFVGYTDQRLIHVAAEYEIAAGKRTIDRHPAPSLIKYRSADEFLERNKRCCTIDRSHFELTNFVSRLMGATEVWVAFWYRAATEGPEQFYESSVSLNACGTVISSRGMSSDRGPTAE